jgi:hypothetical protein
MARHDHEEGRHRRWLEDARKYLRRGDLEGALPALLRLPPPRRDELLPHAAALFRRAVEEQHRRGAWGGLGGLAARVEAEPGLVEQGVDPEEARALYWPLMWAAGRAREWTRAQRLWEPLAKTVRERAPRLAEAVEAWISTQGAPAIEVVAPVLASLPSLDSRLGIEPVRPRVAVPAPRSKAEVEGAVLALAAIEPFPVFARRTDAWAREAPAEVARAVWELAGQLAARELWLRAAADKEVTALAEPASFLARAAREAGASEVLSGLVLQALRVLTARLPHKALSRAEEAEAWCSLAQAAALQPEARPWVLQAVSELRFSEGALPQALRLYEALLALSLDAALWARAFLAWGERHPDAHLAPRWLQEGLRQLIATQAPALVAWLQKAGASESTALMEAVASTCAPEWVESWVEACWEGADKPLRRLLSGAIVILMDRTRDKKAMRRMERKVLSARSLEEAARILLGGEGLEEAAEDWGKLPAEGLRIWRRFAPRMLTYDAEFLNEAVRQAFSPAEAWEAVERYLEANGEDVAYLEALQATEMGGREDLSKRVLARWLERRSGDVQALAEAAVAGERIGIPCKYLHPMLESFLLAVAAQPSSTASAAVKQAQALAREHKVRLRKRKASRKKATTTPTERVSHLKRKGGAS